MARMTEMTMLTNRYHCGKLWFYFRRAHVSFELSFYSFCS